ADVRAFRRLDRAHPAVVGRVDVPDLHARPLTRQTAGAERVEPALVGQAGQRVGVVHELRQLRGAEELPHGRHHRADVDQGLRRYGLDVLGGHPLADDALHPGQAEPDLVLDELADAADAAVAQVVDVVDLHHGVTHRGLAGVQPDEVLDHGDDVLFGQRPRGDVGGDTQLLVDLVAA